MTRERLVRALRGEPVDTVPVWLMRQAGRYLPGYRRLRHDHGILEIARSPELAVEATLEPVRRFDVDAGVVFADITLPFEGLGVDFRIDPGRGPVVPDPVRTDEAVDALTEFRAGSVGFVGEAIAGFLEQEPERPIIGFAGAPFTLAAYLVEGGASREYPETRRMLYGAPERFGRLLDRLTSMTIDYLRMQARAGAAALQLFDTWAGLLPAPEYRELVRPRLQRLVAAVRAAGRPVIYFSTASRHQFEEMGAIGADAIGVDWRTPLGEARSALPREVALQGNLDPGALLGTAEAIERSARAVLDELPTHRGHVFNLGHGVLPETPPEAVGALVGFVHAHGTPRTEP